MIKVKEELARSRVERDTIKKQAESVSKEYDRLTEKYSKLSKSQGNKKDDWNVQLIATYLIKYNFKKMFLNIFIYLKGLFRALKIATFANEVGIRRN